MADWKERNEVADSDDEDEGLIHHLATSDISYPNVNTSVGVDYVEDQQKASASLPPNTTALTSYLPLKSQVSSPPVLLLVSEDDDSEDELALPAPRVNDAAHLDRVPLDRLFSESSQLLRSEPATSQKISSDPGHSGQHQDLGTQIEDPIPSSPLSSLSTTPRGVTPDFLNFDETSSHQLGPHNQGSVRVEIPEFNLNDFRPDNSRAYAPARALRRRNAIQLNPYRVEDAIYRQLSRAAGLAPIRLNRQASNFGEDTQEYVPPPVNDGQHMQHASNGDEQDFVQLGQSSESVFNLNAALLSDFDIPLSPGLEQEWTTGRSQKRRKLGSDTHLLQMDAEEVNTSAISTHHSLDPLLSPPSSASQSQHPQLPTKKSFRYPPGLTPPQLQTPAISSGLRSKRAVTLTDEEESEGEAERLDTKRALTLRAQRPDGDSVPGSENETEVQSVRRKIKGVLPASWLRIDLKNQTASSTKAKVAAAASLHENSRPGVARRITKVRDASVQERRNPQIAFAVPDDTSSEEETAMHEAQSLLGLSGADVLVNIPDADSDSMEEDHIDQMLPIKPRESHGHKRRRKSRQGGSRLFKRPQDRTRHFVQPKISVHLDTQKPLKRTRSTPKLGLVDVFEVSHETTVPDFIKIALRTTRKRRDEGRDVPIQKVMRMSTREQTAELEDTITKWKRGTIQPRVHQLASQRKGVRSPLEQSSGNRVPRGQSRIQATLQEPVPRQPSKQARLMSDGSHGRASRAAQRRPERPVMFRLPVDNGAVPAILETARRTASLFKDERTVKGRTARQSSAPVSVGPTPNLLLERFLEPTRRKDSSSGRIYKPGEQLAQTGTARIRMTRKRLPRHVEPSFHMPTRFQSDEASEINPKPLSELPEDKEVQSFSGFEQFRFDFTIDFDIVPLPSWFRCDTSSLIGDGTLLKVLNEDWKEERVARHSPLLMDLPTTTNNWGPWNETVVAELHQLESWICLDSGVGNIERLRSSALTNALDQLITYFCDGLSFFDSVDREGCTYQSTSFLNKVSECCAKVLGGLDERSAKNDDTTILPALSRLLILSHEICQLSEHATVDRSLTNEIHETLRVASRLMMNSILHDGVGDLVQYQQCVANCATESSSLVAKEKVHALVILRHILGWYDNGTTTFWNLLVDTVPFGLLHTARIARIFERKWFHLFAVLPFLDIGVDGRLSRDQSRSAQGYWPYVECLLTPFLVVDNEQLDQHMYNAYCRSIFNRCYVLANTWHWLKCEPILRVLYDFFARNNLRNLRQESSHRHPQFLEKPEISSMIPQKSDTAYHVFLKLLGSTVLHLRDLYPEKKMRSIILRLTPNHGRSLPKDEVIKQDDLEALRNHHSLLSLLYQVSSPATRPRLELIRQLVHVQDSHRQACHISIRTWTDLTLFHVQRDLSTHSLSPLIDWVEEMIRQLVHQHSTARKEVEAYGFDLSSAIRDSTIASNQSQVEAVLVDLLGSLHRVVESALCGATLGPLLVPMLSSVFELFDVHVPRINNVLQEALSVFQRFIIRADKMISSKDSQEYGDWSAFDELMPATTHETRLTIPDGLQKSLRGLVSNALGANKDVEEGFMTELLQTWTSFAKYQIESGSSYWADYLDLYGKYSWHSFGESDQKTKYTPLFFAMVIDKDQMGYDHHKLSFLRSWISSLAEREAKIKYQGRLTGAILNRDVENVLLYNPPFSRSGASAVFQINASEFEERKLSLVSCILSNMWDSYRISLRHSQSEALAQKQEYSDLLRSLMRTMKENFVALGGGQDRQGAYVDFVQAVVSLMQQYTKDICPIDRFFTDSSQFPLPIHDPNYVVGRLRGYALRLPDTQVQKQLTAFILSSIERAVVDGKQEYLTGQLQCSMLDAFGDGRQDTNLRSFFARSIVPAYTSLAITTSCGWLLVAPLMETLAEVFDHVLLDIDSTIRATVNSTIDSMTHILSAVQRSLQLLLNHPEQLELAYVTRTLQLYYGVVCSMLCPLDYFLRLQPDHEEIILPRVNYLRGFAAYAWCHMDGRPDAQAPPDDLPDGARAPTANNHEYALAGLEATLSTNWVRTGETCTMRGSTGARTVPTDLGPWEQEKGLFAEQLVEFYLALQRLPSFANRGRESWESEWDASVVVA